MKINWSQIHVSHKLAPVIQSIFKENMAVRARKGAGGRLVRKNTFSSGDMASI
jgi:hypothetical protein